MEPPKTDSPKLPDMVMCGDHPSFTKTELNFKEDEKEKPPPSHNRITPTSSRTERGDRAEQRLRTTSEHALRLIEARRRVRLDGTGRQEELALPPNRALVQAALGSFRWPPYLLAVWVVVLIVTHALHCAVTMLERALPPLKKVCQYFRTWTEDAWKIEGDYNQRMLPVGLALLTALLYTLYGTLYVIYSIALWSIEPLSAEIDDKQSSMDCMEAKITNYIDEVSSRTNIGGKL